MSKKKCIECGNELPNGVKNCPNCGTLIKDEAIETSANTKKKLSKCLLISFIIGVLYLLYSVFYWSGVAGASTEAAEQIGAGIATMIVMPHLVCTAIAVIFNALGLFMRKRGFALTGAILYTIALVLFPVYFMFVIIEMILSYVGYAKMKKS